MKKYAYIILAIFIISIPFVFWYSKIVTLDSVVNDPEYVNCERVTNGWAEYVKKQEPCPISEVKIITKH